MEPIFFRSSRLPATIRAWCALGKEDRKSTRLNSSHSQISYAVFCLKKKKGIPASYSGFESAVEQLASLLTALCHQLTVYCRSHVVHPSLRRYRGAHLIHLPLVHSKY